MTTQLAVTPKKRGKYNRIQNFNTEKPALSPYLINLALPPPLTLIKLIQLFPMIHIQRVHTFICSIYGTIKLLLPLMSSFSSFFCFSSFGKTKHTWTDTANYAISMNTAAYYTQSFPSQTTLNAYRSTLVRPIRDSQCVCQMLRNYSRLWLASATAKNVSHWFISSKQTEKKVEIK